MAGHDSKMGSSLGGWSFDRSHIVTPKPCPASDNDNGARLGDSSLIGSTIGSSSQRGSTSGNPKDTSHNRTPSQHLMDQDNGASTCLWPVNGNMEAFFKEMQGLTITPSDFRLDENGSQAPPAPSHSPSEYTDWNDAPSEIYDHSESRRSGPNPGSAQPDLTPSSFTAEARAEPTPPSFPTEPKVEATYSYSSSSAFVKSSSSTNNFQGSNTSSNGSVYKAGRATGGSNFDTSKATAPNELVPPHARSLGDARIPVRAPTTPGVSVGGVPQGNFASRRGPAVPQGNASSSVGVFQAPLHDGSNSDGFTTGSAGQLSAAQAWLQSGSAEQYNLVFKTHPGADLVRRDVVRNGLPAPIGTGRPMPQHQPAVGSSNSAGQSSAGRGVAPASSTNMATSQAQGTRLFVPSGHFRPMTAVTRPMLHPDFDQQRELKEQYGISQNYAGDASIHRNRSADIPNSLNTSLFIINLPANVTHNMLLAQIRGMGRIYACVINPPSREKGHLLSAAKVTFFEVSSTQKFYAYCSNPAQRLIVGGMVARACLNRIKTKELDTAGKLSRVLIIKGKSSFVHPKYLLPWFSRRFTYDIDEIIPHVLNEEMGHLEIRFASFRSQAEAARQALKHEYPPGAETSPIWELRYGVDPCSI